MFGPKNKYNCKLLTDKESIIASFKNSTGFEVEKDYGLHGNEYTSSRLNKVFIIQTESNIFQLSENAGLGGFFEIIGIAKIIQVEKKKIIIELKLQMGTLPINTPQILLAEFLLAGFVFLIISPFFAFILFSICFVFLIGWLSNYIRVKIFFDIVSKAIKIDNNWN